MQLATVYEQVRHLAVVRKGRNFIERGREMKKRIVALMFCAVLIGGNAQADVTVPTMFSDHAVLQRNMLVPVWGTASPGEQVTVDFSGQSKSTEASGSGDWMIYLDPMPANNIPGEMVITGNNQIIIQGVQVGEVWVGSGQSNMQRPLSGDCDADAAITDAENYNMRFFNVTANGGNVGNTVWQVSDSNSAPAMSAVHFFFGRHLALEMPNVPLGMITSAVSATAIERWATCAGSGGLYSGQVVPLQPYGIKGVTWYQGEWDSRSAKDAEKYYWQLPCLVNEWRIDWGQGDFPFYVVQMPKMGISSIHIVRDAELQTALDDPKVEMIVTIDNPGSDVHPPCKDSNFGVRLACLARKFEYDHNIYARAPSYNAAASYVEGTSINVVFDDVAGGLLSSGGPLAEWEVAGSNGNYLPAEAIIVDTDTVKVSSTSVSRPVSARYAFSTNPAANNLVNSAGLPASPIREVRPESDGSYCGDATCDLGENQCNCANDCGSPPATETNCIDDIDDDCDTDIDCEDADCLYDPGCPYCGDATCDPVEDQCYCAADCGVPPSAETNCSGGIDEDCFGATFCICKAKGEWCSNNEECCSNDCRGKKCK
jgi:sialate O-acetylesterase